MYRILAVVFCLLQPLRAAEPTRAATVGWLKEKLIGHGWGHIEAGVGAAYKITDVQISNTTLTMKVYMKLIGPDAPINYTYTIPLISLSRAPSIREQASVSYLLVKTNGRKVAVRYKGGIQGQENASEVAIGFPDQETSERFLKAFKRLATLTSDPNTNEPF